MADKNACGSCQSTSGCGCSTPNPYTQSTQAVWHDPTTYDMRSHGPSYFPKLGRMQRAKVRAFVKEAAFYDTRPVPATSLTPLSAVVQFARALAHIHQSHHWQTHGAPFYADHLLFERLYNESLEFIDQVAERSVGLNGPATVDPFLQAYGVLYIVAATCGHAADDAAPSSLESVAPNLLIERSLRGEVQFLKLIDMAVQELEKNGELSHGISNLLEGIADKHESFVYLLKQRSAPVSTEVSVSNTPAYSYSRE